MLASHHKARLSVPSPPSVIPARLAVARPRRLLNNLLRLDRAASILPGWWVWPAAVRLLRRRCIILLSRRRTRAHGTRRRVVLLSRRGGARRRLVELRLALRRRRASGLRRIVALLLWRGRSGLRRVRVWLLLGRRRAHGERSFVVYDAGSRGVLGLAGSGRSWDLEFAAVDRLGNLPDKEARQEECSPTKYRFISLCETRG